MKWTDLLKEGRLLLLAALIIISLITIHPFSPTNGVLIEGVKSPAPSSLKSGMMITAINGQLISNLTDYNNVIQDLLPGDVVRVTYLEELMPYQYATSTSTAFVATEVDNETSIGLIVGVIPSTHLNFGLEIVGGTKVLLNPNRTLDSFEADNIKAILEQRLNFFGLREVPVNFVTDFSGQQYFRIELAGSTEDDVRTLIEKEGVFEGRIANQTVFTGADLLDVCISGVQCTMTVQPVYVGSTTDSQVVYQFQFQIDLSSTAAERFANITNELSIGECQGTICYLNATLDLYLDGEIIQDGALRLPESIKGEVLTTASITGTRETMSEAQTEMKKLQAILQSRNLPVKMNIVSVETLSPSIGEEFSNNTFTVMMIAIIVVALIIGLRYKSLKVSLPIIMIVLIEVISTLGMSVTFGITLDLSAIAGILASIGTSLDDQIIITDEVLRGEKGNKHLTVKKRLKSALFIVIATFTTSFVSMIPLAIVGAGILRGFAITTIISITIGVIVTRPAYARICELLFKD
ncbi:MAG: hypothetical protein WC307_04220 [Candidatus Nanoarchaeia archaeon]|jgi:preprotein translocase subunit SecD